MTTAAIGPRAEAWTWVRPYVLRGIVGAVVAAGSICALAALLGSFNALCVQLILTVLVLAGFALISWYDSEISARRSHVFALVGILISVYLVFVGVLKIWLPSPSGEIYGVPAVNASALAGGHFAEWLVIVAIARVALLHAHLLIIIHDRYVTPWSRGTAIVTMGLIALVGFLVALPSTLNGTYGEGFWRAVASFLILDVLGTILIPLVNALFGERPQLVPAPLGPPSAGARPPQPGVRTEAPVSVAAGAPRQDGGHLQQASAAPPAWTAPSTGAFTTVLEQPRPTTTAHAGMATPRPAPVVGDGPVAPAQARPQEARTPASAAPAPASDVRPSAARALLTVEQARAIHWGGRQDRSSVQWPVYGDGSPLPAAADGYYPDFSALIPGGE